MAHVPKAAAQLDRDRGLWVVVECPFCGRRNRHQHGAGDIPAELLGARVAHCGALHVGAYELVDAGELFSPDVPQYISDTVLRRAMQVAARRSGFTYRDWRHDYGERTAALTDDEIAARGDGDELAERRNRGRLRTAS